MLEMLLTKRRVVDPLRNKVTALLHMGGPDGSSNFIDSSNTNIFTAHGTAVQSANRARFGLTSAYFDGVNDPYVIAPNNAGYSFGTGDFVIECFIYMDSVANKGGGNSTLLAGLGPNADGQGINRWVFYVTTTGRLGFQNNNDDTVNRWSRESNDGTIVAKKWIHVAVERASGTVRLFIDGKSQGFSTNYQPSTTTVNSVAGLCIGNHVLNGISRYWGSMQELRITKAATRYINNFTPPPAPFS